MPLPNAIKLQAAGTTAALLFQCGGTGEWKGRLWKMKLRRETGDTELVFNIIAVCKGAFSKRVWENHTQWCLLALCKELVRLEIWTCSTTA